MVNITLNLMTNVIIKNISNIPLSNLRIVLPDGNVMTLLSTSLDLRPTAFRSKGCIGGDSSM